MPRPHFSDRPSADRKWPVQLWSLPPPSPLQTTPPPAAAGCQVKPVQGSASVCFCSTASHLSNYRRLYAKIIAHGHVPGAESLVYNRFNVL